MQIQMAVMHDGLQEADVGGIELAVSQLKCLENEVMRVQELANDFLAYGRPSPDQPEPIDLLEAVRGVAEFVRPEVEQIGGSVTVRAPDGGGPVVNTDPAKLRQVLFNLAVNATQAMQDGGQLTFEAGRASDGEAFIRVQDTGCGIPPDKLPRVFEAFYSTKDEGTGLGLAIVKQTVEASGGRIHVESECGVGTSFTVALPLGGAPGATHEPDGADDAASVQP
jgi:signal transduction histidine kinase